MGFFSRISGRRRTQKNSGESKLDLVSTSGRPDSTPDPREISLESISYVPLPRSPDVWEVREPDYGELELLGDPETAPVLYTYGAKQYNKVLLLMREFPPEARVGHLGRVCARAYRNIVRKREAEGKPHIAAKWCAELFEELPSAVTNRDRRKLNKLIRECEKLGKKCPYSQVELLPEQREPLFTVSPGSGWAVASERKLPMDERPDPAFDLFHITRDGCVLEDCRGRSKRFPGAEAVLQKRDAGGRVAHERALDHDIDVRSSNPTSDRFAYMSSDGLFVALDAELLETSRLELGKRPEVRRLARDWWDHSSYRIHIDSVDVSHDGERLLYTVDDEAWCLDSAGRILWSIKMPLPDGWEPFVDTSEVTGTSAEVGEALRLMSLSLPCSPDEVKQRYKELALKWHPDVNRSSSASHDRMVELNHAYEVLTGTNPADLEFGPSTGVSYRQKQHSSTITAGGVELTMTASIITDRMGDWLHASSFAASGGTVYVGSEKGKVVQLSSDGQPQRVYDVGNSPERIVDTGDRLFIQTRTRLYVIRGDSLETIVDILGEGDLVLGQTGFGLMSEKSFRWFSADGSLVGEVATRHPIRLVHPIPGGILVSTRQHEAEIAGPPPWWHGAAGDG